MKSGVLANKPVIINAAISGMAPTKEDTPHVPITIEEIAGELGRPPATPQQIRQIIGLPSRGASG